jgi:hypothetical protein
VLHKHDLRCLSTAGYNIPELQNGPPLLLDYATIAGILLRNITMWNDQRIKDINPSAVADLLPAQPIIMIAQARNSSGPPFGPIQTISTVLKRMVPDYRDVRSSHFALRRIVCSAIF